MKLVKENIEEYKPPLFRCGWCGAPTNSQGVNLEGQDFDDAVERIAKDEEAIKTPGNCCRGDAQGHEELMRQAMEDEYLGEDIKAKSVNESMRPAIQMEIEDMMVETLADLEHDRWSHWQEHLHSLCEKNPDGSLTIPAKKVERWERQINTKYKDLSEKEKDSDRDEARKTVEAIKKYM